MFTHMVYYVSLGVVDISTPCAGVFESIIRHMLVFKEFGVVDEPASFSFSYFIQSRKKY